MRRAAPLLLLLLLALASCRAQRGEPFDRPAALDEQGRRGQLVYMRHCNSCHPNGAGGLGPALNNKPLPAPAVRLQVREGVGAMPAFPGSLIPDGELEDLVAFVSQLRRS